MKIKIGNKEFELTKEQIEKGDTVDLAFEGVIRTKEEEETFYKNTKTEIFKEAEEVKVKQYRDTYGFEGRTIEQLIEGVKSHTLKEAKREPNEQIDTLSKTIKEKEAALKNALSKVDEVNNSFKQYKNQSLIENTLNSVIPENTILPKSDISLIIKNKLKFDVAENGRVIVKNEIGEILKNSTTADPLNPKEVVEDFFKTNQNYLKPIEGGAGGGDSRKGGGKKQSLDDFIKEQSDKGIELNSEEFTKNYASKLEAGEVE